MKKIIKIAFFDFDGCLCDSPLPEFGKKQWSKQHNKPWPYIGWWGKIESMCSLAFDIKTHKTQHDSLKELQNQGYKIYILTSRLFKFEPIIEEILIKNDIQVDGILTNINNTKGQRIVQEIKKWNDKEYIVSDVIFFDDRMKEIITAEAVIDELLLLGTTIKIIKV